jgi:RNA polymerase sigma factor (sigma-70 family)
MSTEPSFEQIVRNHQQMVFRTLLRLTGHREGLEDLAQEVFLRLYKALPGFRGEALVSTYLYRITVNVAQDAVKRRSRDAKREVSLSEERGGGEEGGWTLEDRLAHPGRTPEEMLADREFQRTVEAQLMRLSGVERAVLVLYHQEERSYEQIAEALRMPIGTVRTHLHRGRKKLKDAVAEGRR